MHIRDAEMSVEIMPLFLTFQQIQKRPAQARGLTDTSGSALFVHIVHLLQQ